MSKEVSTYFTKRDQVLMSWLIKYGVVDYRLLRRKLYKDNRRISHRRLKRYRGLGVVEDKITDQGNFLLRILPSKIEDVAALLKRDINEVKSTNLHRPTLTTKHSAFCSRVGIELESLFHYGRLITESEMLYFGLQMDLMIDLDGAKKPHRPDMIYSNPDLPGVYQALEVELTAKSIRRVRAVLKSYLESKDIGSVLYFCGSDYLASHLQAIYEPLWLQLSKDNEFLNPQKVLFCNIHEFLKEPLGVRFEGLNGTRFLDDVFPSALEVQNVQAPVAGKGV